MAAQSYAVGDTVLTRYGVGVIVQQKPVATKNDATLPDDRSLFHIVRLWRNPEGSVGSTSIAYLGDESILKHVPAAPGMTVKLASSKDNNSGNVAKYKVMTYYVDSDSYLLSKIRQKIELLEDDESLKVEDSSPLAVMSKRLSSTRVSIKAKYDSVTHNHSHNFIEVPNSQIDAASGKAAAKFYPLLHTLMTRGDQTAKLSTQLWKNETTQKLVQQTSSLVSKTTKQLELQADGVASSVDKNKINEMIDKAKPSAEEGVQHVLKMLKDQKLTELLDQCQERLKQLTPSTISASTQEALNKAGIHIDLTTYSDIAKGSIGSDVTGEHKEDDPIQRARRALQQILSKSQLDTSELESIQGEVSKHFASAVDNLAQVAKADQSLNELFLAVSERTTEWQQATGQLLQTRSANLFMEGATRLQARAAAILKQHQLDWAVGSQLTKAFTEGDAALARLKSIEVGDSIKDRLVEAIQARSESLGGLDGIIAGAMKSVSGEKGEEMKKLLANVQNSATSARLDAHETLISILSQQSVYRDVALVRIEEVLIDLDRHLGDDLSAADIAAFARGEGGTSKIFEPIARRAMAEIDKQIEAAESQVTDKTVAEVLRRIRKILSGDLSIGAVTDEIVNILNDEKVVSAGETIVLHSESVLDALEGVSGNKAINDAIKIAEKAGITKDSVMREIEKIDVNSILDTAGDAVSDEASRRKLISNATDTALDFVLRILPSMPVPPFEGVRDGLVYHISNLSMEGFHVRKEDIQIELAGLRATKKRNATTVVDASAPGLSVESQTPELQRVPSMGSETSVNLEQTTKHVKASELLIVEINRIGAVLENAEWSFEQTYMPYLKGKGTANVNLSDGFIRLQFELRKQKKSESDWEPVLCLHDRSCRIGEVELKLLGESRLAWILNKLVTIFKGPLRDYVVRTITKVLTHQSGWILHRLNKVLQPYWSLILRTAKLNMDDLEVATEDDVLMEVPSSDNPVVELAFFDRLPLGINLLMNDESSRLKVVDFPRGSQARAVCEKRNLDPEVFKGATLVSVNGTYFEDQEDLFDALRDPGRPKTVQFELSSQEEAERLRQFVEGEEASKLRSRPTIEKRKIAERDVEFDEGDLGINFGNAPDNFALVVNSFSEDANGALQVAEKTKQIMIGDILLKINDTVVAGGNNMIATAASLLQDVANKRPLKLTFVQPYMFRTVIERVDSLPGGVFGGPEEMQLAEEEYEDKRKKVVLTGFKEVSGAAESNGIMLGDYLVFINGLPVGLGCRWVEDSHPPTMQGVLNMLQNTQFYPIGLTFARPKQRNESSRWSPVKSPRHLCHSEADTVCVTANDQSKLGIELQEGHSGDICVKDFEAIPGMFSSTLAQVRATSQNSNLTVVKVDNEFVPTYATANMVLNAISRAWKTHGKVILDLCDDECKAYVESIVAG